MSDLFLTAREHFQKGHYKMAEPLLQQLATESTEIKPDVPYMLGAIAFDKGKLKRAIALFKKALAIDPKFTDASVGLSIILNDLGKYGEAKEVFETAYTHVKKEQKQPTSRGLRSKKSKPVDTEKLLSEKHMELGLIYKRNHRLQEAILELEKAINLDRLNLEASNALTECYSDLQNDPGNISKIEEELKEKYSAQKHFLLIEAYLNSGQTQRAEFELDKMQIRVGTNPQIESWRKKLAGPMGDMNL